MPPAQCTSTVRVVLETPAARGSVVGSHTALQAYHKSASVPMTRMNVFHLPYLILPAAVGPWVYSASNSNEYQKQRIMFLWSRAPLVREADNLTAIHEPIV
jgi:hypothetical protein